jgi:hypothetical protein
MEPKVAQHAPAPPPMPSVEGLLQKLSQTLQDDFCLGMLPEFSVIVEGWTDHDYLVRAAELTKEKTGEDLLAVPEHLCRQGPARIAIRTPGKPGDPTRGGTPQMVRLAEKLQSYVFTLELFAGMLFLFDHDDEGQRARDQIADFGFRRDVNSLTLDPKHHPCACAKKQVTIEDLLSLNVQQRFFNLGGAWCRADYEGGRLIRYVWGHQSKPLLRNFVKQHATWEDLREVARVLARVRVVFGLPVDMTIFV